MADYVLVHYGVKGMKWGVRKDRPISKRKQARLDSKAETRRDARVHAEARYIRKGKSPEEAARLVDRNLKIAKIVSVTAGVALTAAAINAGNNYRIKQFTETVIEKGQTLQHIRPDTPNFAMDRRLYATFLKGDQRRYDGLFINHLLSARKGLEGLTDEQRKAHGIEVASKIAKHTLQATERIHAPSQEQAAGLYKEFLTGRGGSLGREASKWGKQAAKLNYRQFNRELVTGGTFRSAKNNVTAEQFYDFMKSKGYNAILDANDQFFSGFNAKKPIIVFNPDSTLAKAGKTIVNEQAGKRLGDLQTAGVVAKQLAPLLGIGAGIGTLNYRGKRGIAESNTSAAVDEYLKRYPGSNLTRAEIAANLGINKKGAYVTPKKEIGR